MNVMLCKKVSLKLMKLTTIFKFLGWSAEQLEKIQIRSMSTVKVMQFS
jgi:hypothetical protein